MSSPVSRDSIPAEAVDLYLVTGEAVALDLRPTSFVLRSAGAAIDLIAYYGLFILLTVLTYTLFGILSFDAAIGAAIGVGTMVFCFVALPTGIELLTKGKSLGRLAVGARIVRDDGGAIGFRHAFVRALFGVLELFATFGGLAALTGLLNDKSKRIGDYLAGTYSQNERVAASIPPTFGVPIELVHWSTTADVARMPDQLTRRMSQFLRQAGRLTPASRARLSRLLADEASVYVSPLPRADPELFVAAVVAMRRERETTALALEAKRLELLGPALGGLPHAFPKRG